MPITKRNWCSCFLGHIKHVNNNTFCRMALWCWPFGVLILRAIKNLWYMWVPNKVEQLKTIILLIPPPCTNLLYTRREYLFLILFVYWYFGDKWFDAELPLSLLNVWLFKTCCAKEHANSHVGSYTWMHFPWLWG